MDGRGMKAQSAMEYLMTYGWAILIIAIVISAFFALGVFNSGALLGTSCVGASGFSCTAPVLSHANGNLSFTFGQSTGSPFFNVGFACTGAASISGAPSPSSAMVYASGSGAATATSANAPATGALSVVNGQTVKITGLKCFDANGSPLSATTSPVGKGFGASLWINYTLNSGAPGGNNPMITAQFATVALTAS